MKWFFQVYYAPEFFHDFNEKLKGQRIPKITELGMTPEKWEHYNKAWKYCTEKKCLQKTGGLASELHRPWNRSA